MNTKKAKKETISEQSNKKSTREDKIDSLSSALCALRRDKDTTENNQIIKQQILSNLGYEKALSNEQFDAFVIEAVLECFGEGLNSDILLAASGLLAGYYYHLYPKIMGRKNKFLENSNYLQNYPPSKTAKKKSSENNDDSPEFLDDPTIFNRLDNDGKRICRTNLASIESSLFNQLAEFLFNKKDIEEYIEKEKRYLRKNTDTGEMNLVLPRPACPEANYERLIWWELKKSNEKRGFFPFHRKSQNEETPEIEGTLETTKVANNKVIKIILNTSKFFAVVFFVGIIVNFIPSPSVEHDPTPQSGMYITRPIDTTRKNGTGKNKSKNTILQKMEDEKDRYSVQTAKKHF